MKFPVYFILVALLTWGSSVALAKDDTACKGKDVACLLSLTTKNVESINQQKWRDSTYREIAKLYAAQNKTDDAIAILDKIETPDTKALTIRGIGMEVAKLGLSSTDYNKLFALLTEKAEEIKHLPSNGIAFTYIAMAQAFAGDNKGAYETAIEMKNPALRNKAFAESAEIQAELNNATAALESLAAIDDAAFRDKGHRLVSKIMTDQKSYDEAVTFAQKIQDPYQRSQSLLYVLVKQITPDEVKID